MVVFEAISVSTTTAYCVAGRVVGFSAGSTRRPSTSAEARRDSQELSRPSAEQLLPHKSSPASSLRRTMLPALCGGVVMVVGALLASSPAAAKRPEGVNRPELLPNTDGNATPVIDVIKLLSDRQRRVIEKQAGEIEAATGVKLRVLAQTYPTTPGLAIRDYWKVDDRTLVYVHDTGGLGPNAVVNFNAGTKVEAMKPLTFWRQTQNKYQDKFYLDEHGDADTLMAVVEALRDAFVPQASAK
eukprot:CAMPEP_0170612954 /NCGR_PEP_ID=MMETSP0224-20130122/24007_1 /TAXON_ID=285029 /ORGANISM="Togula jolla, Strain CCCM 725" /LENGTH=241 /DNA_ID=CAMNT_0010938509 /DNA_START=185 /DNA_END=910 /DNA_ORIENTATION=-